MMTVSLMGGYFEAADSFEEASALVRAEIRERGVGASGWYGKGAGRIYVDGRQIANVSYNGRVWEGADQYSNSGRLVWEPK